LLAEAQKSLNSGIDFDIGPYSFDIESESHRASVSVSAFSRSDAVRLGDRLKDLTEHHWPSYLDFVRP